MNTTAGIVFGVCVGPTQRYATICLPSIRRHCPDARVIVRERQRSIPEAYNAIAAEALAAGADAVAFVHDDVELREDPRPQLARCLQDAPDAAVVGVVGSSGAQFHWWPDGEARGYAADTRQVFDFGGGTHDVEVVDGLFLALSRWALENLHFDAAIGAWHGYDSDICRQAGAAGRRVLVTDVALFHHARPLAGYDLAPFEQARAKFLLKWHPEATWRRRLLWRARSTGTGLSLARTIRTAVRRP